MAPSVALYLLVSLLFSVSSSIAKTPSLSSRPPRALFLPVTKDHSTNQYITQINQRTPFSPVKLVVDLGGESLWVDCDKGYKSSTYKPVHCRSSLCSLLKTPFGCGECYGGPKPGCYNHSCSFFPTNSVTGVTTHGELAKDIVSLQSTNGSNPGPLVSVPRFVFTCGATFLLKNLAKGTNGMAGFGRTPIGLPSQFSHAFRFSRKFAICLSSYGTGVIFFGDGPYVMLPGIDISYRLNYTPLLINKIGAPYSTTIAGSDPSAEYYIGVRGIKINGEPVAINTTLLKINKEGYGGTKISTTVPYTTLETSIYKAVTNTLIKMVSGVPRMKPVAPFKLCYNASSFGSTRLGPGFPPVDLVLQDGKTLWTFFGANSLVSVEGGRLCLAFVDGGVGSVNAIVIGGYQLENAILQFDLEKSRLGFISTILGARTTCGNFNFTSIA
ncbi:hypothetical protein M9H77_36592 [Catharanthus roseus]|uniref:Uncharacterized protein n=1 Tax=Catharanthus roseus TaxID=4058 RepID=A0ACB9ZS85_CATRO|nr:hypothetical protein M9H77_36592 [Catharanthus roseus]